MKRIINLGLGVFLLCVLASSCASKLTTIRPTLIDRIVVRDCATEETTEMIRGTQDEMDWQMDDVVFQMEQMYQRDGDCAAEDSHLYELSLYMNDKPELMAYINRDGSVCKNGIRYIRAAQDGSANHPIDLEFYAGLFD
jgi:hypothetical protein